MLTAFAKDQYNYLILAKILHINTKPIYIEIFILAATRPDIKTTRWLKDVLMQVPYSHAKAKILKIFSPEEINSASGLEEARKLLYDEKVLFRKEDKGGRGRQKKETIPENMERMAAAHQVVEELDLKVKNIQDAFKAAKTVALRELN